MRAVSLLLLALLLAGCAADDQDDPAGQPTATSPGTTPPSGDAAPSEVRLAHDYTSGQPETATFLLNTTGPYAVYIGFRGGDDDAACVGIDARLVVRTPSGETFADVSGSNVSAPCGSSGRSTTGATLPVGEWTAEFTGRGALSGVVEITPA